MKVYKITMAITAVSILGLTCCNPDEETSQIDSKDVELEAVYDETYEEVDGITESAMDFFDMNARTAEDPDEDLIRCGQSIRDPENKTITIDFGGGCEGPGGRIRKGKIVITYTGRMYESGSVVTTTFRNFYINDIRVDGIRTRTNLSNGYSDNAGFAISLENGKLTWPDSTFATREMHHIRTRVRSDNPRNNEFTVEGNSEGVNRRGVSYQVRILDRIHFKRACRASGIFIPVEGIKIIRQEGLHDIQVDYGDGTCDSLVKITINGVSRVVDLRKIHF